MGTGEPESPRAAPTITRAASVDAITGLPLWEYRFAGNATLEPGSPAPALAWRVLEVTREGHVTRLRSESNMGAEPLPLRPHALDDRVANLVLGALREAQTLGCSHGDLTAERLYRRGDRVWIEGYGVPWNPLATWEDDVRSVTQSLLALPNTRLSEAMRARLHAAHTTLRWSDADAFAPQPTKPAAEPAPRIGQAPPATARTRTRTHTRTPVRPEAALKVPEPLRPAVVVQAAMRLRGRLVEVTARLTQKLAAWWPLAARWVAAATRRLPQPSGDGFLNAQQRLLLAALILVGGVAWGALSLRPSPTVVEATVWGGAARLVDVRVEPTGLPPVALVVVESPPGSVHAPGSVLGTVPGRVLLDQDGRWQLAVRFAGVSSERVTLLVPFERELAFTHPQPPTP